MSSTEGPARKRGGLRAKVGRSAYLAGRTVQVLAEEGLATCVDRLRSRFRERFFSVEIDPPGADTEADLLLPESCPPEPIESARLIDEHWSAHRAMRTIETPDSRPRVSIVTCSVGRGSLFGGTGTSLVLGALLANRLGANLRLITRSEPPDPAPVHEVLTANRISLCGSLETAFAPTEGGDPVSISPHDLFLSTAWWNTRRLLRSIPRSQLIGIVQEDERMFYHYGDERLLCAETLAEGGFPVVINTEQLYRHLVDGPEPLANLKNDGLWFEPAFPASAQPRAARVAGAKRRFFFYARPGMPRNLFWRGVEALAAAIEARVFSPDEWEFHWLGTDIPPVSLPHGVMPIVGQCLSWSDYQRLVRSMDAGFSLMYTPHPSYPPLDLAASGAAVLTNEHPGKADLSHYSKNILVAKPALESLVEGLARLAALARDDKARAENRATDRIARDWAVSFRSVLDRLVERMMNRPAGRRAA